MKKLSEAKNGETGVISAICGDTRFLSRVTSIGLTIGCPVTVLQNERKGIKHEYGTDQRDGHCPAGAA